MSQTQKFHLFYNLAMIMDYQNEENIAIAHYNPEEYRLRIEHLRIMSQNFEFSMKDITITVFVKENYYYMYNFFVNQYNEDENRIQDKYMKKLNCLFFTTFPCCCCYVAWIIFSIVVLFSVPTFLYNLFRFLTLIRIIITLKENKINVPNPFQNMIYCKSLVGCNEYYLITTRIYTTELQRLGISLDCFNYVISSIDNSTQTINMRLMFYNDGLLRYYTGAPKAVCFDMCITTTLLLISLISAIATIAGVINTFA